MSERLLARRYAGSLVDLTDRDQLESLLDSLTALESALSPFMDSIFLNPDVSQSKQMEILEKGLKGQEADRLVRFLRLLVKKQRIGLLPDIVEACEAEINRRLGRKQAAVESAVDLRGNQRNSLRQGLQELFNSDIVLEENIDSSLLAGVRVRVDDYRMDYTVRNQLEQLRSQFSRRT